MPVIENIKQKILQMDAGSYQHLCDSYLSKKGYHNINSLGSEAGTRKTRKGTPDTHFINDDGSYVFAEYTTQKSQLFKKMSDDIKKCLDTSKTGVSHDKIAEIIYCHCSSGLKPSHDSELRTLCTNAGIPLKIK